jgi:hypothetical protein
VSDSAQRAAVAVLLVGLVVLHASAVPLVFVDDAWISFRYAWNLVHGHGLTFHASAPPVEGFSNPTWVLAAALVLALGLPLQAGLKVLAVVLQAATVLLLVRALRELGRAPGVAIAAGALLAAQTAWVVPLLSGLEGPLFSFLLLLAVLALGRCLREPAWRHGAWAGAAGVLLAATRPEGALVFGALLAAAAVAAAVTPAATARRLAPAALAFAAGLVLLGAWRLATYDSLVPNAVLAKLGGAGAVVERFAFARYGNGLRYFWSFVATTWPPWLAVAGAVVVQWRSPARLPAASTTLLALSTAGLAAGLAVVLSNNGDWMPHHRLLAPYVPMVVLCAALLAATSARRSIVVAAVLALASIAPEELDRPAAQHLATPSPWPGEANVCRLGRELEAATVTPERLVVASELMGVFGYCAPRLPLRDLNGLTDAAIARSEPSGGVWGRKTRPATLEAMGPDAILINDLSYWRRLLDESPWFASGFVALACDELYASRLYAFVRRDSPLAGPGRIPLCPGAGVEPVGAFRRASCLRPDWPYDFPRSCGTG